MTDQPRLETATLFAPLTTTCAVIACVAVAVATGPAWALVVLVPFAWALVAAAAVDLACRRIPNAITYRLAPLMALLLIVPTLAGEGSWNDYARGWLYGLGLPAAMLTVGTLYRLVRGGGLAIGMGDIKLAVSLGLVVGWDGGWEILVLAYATAIYGAIAVAVTVATGRAKRTGTIPYGPPLAAGALTAVTVSDPLLTILA